MNKYYKLIIIAILSSCVSGQPIGLDGQEVEEGEGNEQLVKKSALAYNKGVVDFDWKTLDQGLDIFKASENMVVTMTEAKQKTFFKEYEGLDFRGKLALKVEARFVSDSDVEGVKVRLLMTDAQGLITNGKDVDNTIQATTDFKPYFFRLKGAFVQTFPELKNVNGADIRKLAFVVAPTGKAASGRIEFKTIKVVSDQEVFKPGKIGAEGAEGAVVYNSDTDFKVGEWSIENGYEISEVAENLVIKTTGVGPRYEKFSRNIPLTKATKMKVVAKYEGNVQPFIRFDLIDVNGFATNRKPAMVRLLPGGYAEYTLDYSRRNRQAYPKTVDVDLSRITKVSGYLDPAYLPFTGTVFIKSIELF